MPNVIISDTSCLILLNNIGELDLLKKLYNKITVTVEVADEFGESIPDWIEIKSASNLQAKRILELQVDYGEASAIALAIEYPECLLIVDDNKARKVATNLGISITGTIGVIAKAKLNGIIPSVIPLLQKIKQTNFRLSDELYRLAVQLAKE